MNKETLAIELKRFVSETQVEAGDSIMNMDVNAGLFLADICAILHLSPDHVHGIFGPDNMNQYELMTMSPIAL